MTDVPRRPPPDAGDRLRVIANRAAPGSMLGSTRMTQPVRAAVSNQSGGRVEVVIHGSDGTVPRPGTAIVMWVGSATPSNAVAFDFWYPADV